MFSRYVNADKRVFIGCLARTIWRSHFYSSRLQNSGIHKFQSGTCNSKCCWMSSNSHDTAIWKCFIGEICQSLCSADNTETGSLINQLNKSINFNQIEANVASGTQRVALVDDCSGYKKLIESFLSWKSLRIPKEKEILCIDSSLPNVILFKF